MLNGVCCVCWQGRVARSARASAWTVLRLPRRCAAARTSKVRSRFRSVEAVSIEHHVELDYINIDSVV
jgi:hypothetical protein